MLKQQHFYVQYNIPCYLQKKKTYDKYLKPYPFCIPFSIYHRHPDKMRSRTSTQQQQHDNLIYKVHKALLASVSPATQLLSPCVGDDVCAGVVYPGKGLYLTRATILGLTETTRRVFCFDLGSVTFVPRTRIWVLGRAAAVLPRASFSISIRNGCSYRKVRLLSWTPAAVETLIVQSINEDGSCGVTPAQADPVVHETLLAELQSAAKIAPFLVKQLEVGDYVLALSRPDDSSQLWCRSLVLGKADKGVAAVEHVDYGCFEDVPVRDIRSLPPYLAIEPALALVLRTDLAGVTVKLNCKYRFAIGDPVDSYGRMYMLGGSTGQGEDERQEAGDHCSNSGTVQSADTVNGRINACPSDNGQLAGKVVIASCELNTFFFFYVGGGGEVGKLMLMRRKRPASAI